VFTASRKILSSKKIRMLDCVNLMSKFATILSDCTSSDMLTVDHGDRAMMIMRESMRKCTLSKCERSEWGRWCGIVQSESVMFAATRPLHSIVTEHDGDTYQQQQRRRQLQQRLRRRPQRHRWMSSALRQTRRPWAPML
jgi:hypothetical protein